MPSWIRSRLAAERQDVVLAPDTFKVIDTNSGEKLLKGETDMYPSYINEEEAKLVAKECKKLLDKDIPPEEIGVISFYRAQTEYIQKLLREFLGIKLSEKIQVDTVDAFQGREKTAIILSVTRSNPQADVGFLNDQRRLNVALSRAKDKLIIIGDFFTLCRSSSNNTVSHIFKKILDYAEELKMQNGNNGFPDIDKNALESKQKSLQEAWQTQKLVERAI